MYDIQQIREDFPILAREVHGRKLVYLDNAATTQKPLAVLDAMRSEYLNQNANVHRGVHYLSQQATELHEAARERVRQFINARSSNEIIFTRGTTEAINLVAATFCQSQMGEGDEVLVTDMEHHSNIVPWQMQAQSRGIVVRHLPVSDEGTLRLDLLDDYLSDRTHLVSLCHVSNVLGTVNPVEEIIKKAHDRGIPVLVDAAQSAPHMSLDVQALDCDFMAFSGHKMYGPTGIGVLYGKETWLDRLPPYQGGGEMISSVSWEGTTFNELPFKFEAGTPDYVATHGLATAIDYITALGLDSIHAHEQQLLRHCVGQLSAIPSLRILGPSVATDLHGLTRTASSATDLHGLTRTASSATDLHGLKRTASSATDLNGLTRTVRLSPSESIAEEAVRLSPCKSVAEEAVRVSPFKSVATEEARVSPCQSVAHDAVVSFVVDGIHPLDMGTLLDQLGVAVRTGHHCAQPLVERFGLTSTVRASFALYNTLDEVDALAAALRRVIPMLR